MDGKAYKISVLHIHNPHLIWVEVNHGKKSKCGLRQIGLFGVVPKTSDGKLSSRWDPQASQTAKKFIKKVENLSFRVSYCDDDGTSIFDNQPHVFGDIFGYHKGNQHSLAACLDSLGYIHCGKKEFIKVLAKGNIQTTLDGTSAMSVFMKIIQHYQDEGIWENKKEIFYNYLTTKQLKELQKYQAETLTIENVTRHLQMSDSRSDTRKHMSKEKSHKLPNTTGQKIYNDLNSESVELRPVDFVEDILRKHIIDLPTANDPQSEKTSVCYDEKEPKFSSMSRLSNNITVYYDEIHSHGESDEEIINNGSERAIGRANSRTKFGTDKIRDKPNAYHESLKFDYLVKLRERSKISTKNVSTDPSQRMPEYNGSKDRVANALETKSSARRRMQKTSKVSSPNEGDEISSNDASSKHNKSGKRLVAYGPPTKDLMSLVVKEPPKEDVLIEAKPPDHSIAPWKEDDVDSNVGIDITNCAKLKKDDQSGKIKCDLGLTDKRDLDPDSLEIGYAKDVTSPDINDDRHDRKQKNTRLNDFIKSRDLRSSSDKIKHTNQDRIASENCGKKSKLLAKLQKIKNSSGSEDKSCDPMSSTGSSLRETEKDISSTDDDLSFAQKNTDSSSHQKKQNDDTLSSIVVTNSTSSKVQDSDEEEFAEIQAKLALKYKPIVIEKPIEIDVTDKVQINVNPYKNLDGSQSVFVENLIAPLLLAHTKNQNKVLPRSNLRDVPFKPEIHCVLRNMQVKTPSRLQTVSWAYILRGHSVFMIGSAGSGKTLGYLPAVCNLVIDYNFQISGQGPICIIVCATAQSVADVARQCKMFLNHQRVMSCFPGLDNARLVTDLLNGCEILVTTPSMLCRFLGVDIGVDLRRVTTVVFDDCERLSQVYECEVKAIQYHVKQMLKTRTDRQLKVQYIVASRQWCDFMIPLAKKAPDTIVTFAAFHECVLYSKTNTSVSYVMKDKKIDAVVDFLKETTQSKLTVIVCRSDDEVELLENKLKRLYSVVACNNQMTLHDLYKMRTEKLDSSILICCDGNLNHLNVTRANYLIHFSMPALYSQFCSRFSVLNENYPSIFEPHNDDVKIKVLLEENNLEQLPKILNFVKRCTKVPDALDEVSRKVLEEKDLAKAQRFVPICDSILALGECVDTLSANCQERHVILGGYDDPKPWVPRQGFITFKIIHYNSAVSYSARLLTNTTGNEKTKYPETYATLCMKLGLFYSKDENKRLHGEPKVGDVCAVAVKQNFMARCQVLKVLSYEKGNAKEVVIKLIDEEQLEIIRAVDLYYLPDEFKVVETHVVKIRLANIQPLDKDITFSELAKNKLKSITDGDEQLYFRSRVTVTIGNSIFVDTLEACQDLFALCETVVKHDFKKVLLETHAIPNVEHIPKLKKLCEAGNLKVTYEPRCVAKKRDAKNETEHRWAHLDRNDWSEIIFSNTINAGKFFVRLEKFDKCVNSLVADIRNYVDDNPTPVENVAVNDIVLAEFPDDSVYERAIVEEIINETKVLCFFVDNGDWRIVPTHKLKPITKKIIQQIPFQSIECRLLGIQPPVDSWIDFSSNWLHDNCSEDSYGEPKRMFVKYFTKEKAEVTGGHKYGVVLVDTTTQVELVINKRMIELNLAAVKQEELEYLEKPLDFIREKSTDSSTDYEEEMKDDKRRGSKDLIPIPITLIPKHDEHEKTCSDIDKNMSQMKYVKELEETRNQIVPYLPNNVKSNEEKPHATSKKMFSEPIRSVPLVSDSDEDSDKWDVCFGDNFKSIIEPLGFKCSQLTDANKLSNTEDNNITKDSKVVVPSHIEGVSLTANNTEVVTNTSAKVTEAVQSERDVQDQILTLNEKKNTVDIDKNLKIFRKTQLNQKGITEILNTSDVTELNETDILRDGIKDVSIYDSDDTLSIVSNDDLDPAVRERIKMITNKISNERPVVLDSDDTLSLSTADGEKCEKTETVPSIVIKNERGLDSDDLETEDELITRKTQHSDTEEFNNPSHINITPEVKTRDNLNSSKLIDSKTIIEVKTIKVTGSNREIRTPPLVWKQDNQTVTIKIKLIGVEKYTLSSGNRSLKFETYHEDCKYAFDIELYGVIEREMTTHSNKGQYILVKLVKYMKKSTKWLKLTKDIKNWIFYDVDSLDTSSDEETPKNDDALNVIMGQHERALETDDDDDWPDDTALYRYRDE